MLIKFENGATLELLWRHAVSSPSSALKPAEFVSIFSRDAETLRSLRQFLAQRLTHEVGGGLSDDELLRRTALLIGSGEIVAAEYRFRDRRPGTGVVFGLGVHTVLLIWRDTLRPGPDLKLALEWLATLEQDPKEVDRLRILLSNTLRTFTPGWSGAGFLEETARLLIEQELIPIYHARTRVQEAVAAPLPSHAPPPKARDREEPEGETFEPNHAAQVQADALRAGAETGAPFCEVCAREAAQEDAA